MILQRRRHVITPATLKPYQEPHAEHLAEVIRKHGAALDMSDTGTGKTYAAAAVAMKLGLRLCVIGQKRSAEKWLDVAVQMRSGFFLSCGWEEAKTKKFPHNWLEFSPKRGGGLLLKSVQWSLPKDVLLVFDEAHKAKGYITENALVMAGARGIPTLMSSATLASTAGEMYASGYVATLHNRTDFQEWASYFGWSVASGRKPKFNGDDTALLRLHNAIFPELGSRMRVRDIEGFPENNVFPELITVDHPEELSAWRRELLSRVADLQAHGKNVEAANLRMKYRQAAELAKLPAIIEKAQDAVDEGNSVAIFVNFRETVFTAMKLLHRNAVCLYGMQDEDEYKDALARFQSNEVHVCIATLGAGGTSNDMHDLLGRPRVSIISPSDNPVELRQVLGRIHREGSLSPAIQYILYMAGVEEDVYYNVKNKCDNIDTLNDGDLKL